ncbi:hypothetical protein [Geobacter sp. DSM 9736]|uniref:hypothetical protein n=1 Tax=Geobacter sp. DSM 9736 TaxID=1277350 RepID=UPI000B61A510|nr:hypothetical protein [Geobacter sp. DSM 9736]SNB45941.1 hypothetical protein SAMN06269301_1375 [Geobacter sp. DSM 9736]
MSDEILREIDGSLSGIILELHALNESLRAVVELLTKSLLICGNEQTDGKGVQ